MKGILLIPLLLISNFSLFAQYEMECYHHNYLENQEVYAWKYDGTSYIQSLTLHQQFYPLYLREINC